MNWNAVHDVFAFGGFAAVFWATYRHWDPIRVEHRKTKRRERLEARPSQVGAVRETVNQMWGRLADMAAEPAQEPEGPHDLESCVCPKCHAARLRHLRQTNHLNIDNRTRTIELPDHSNYARKSLGKGWYVQESPFEYQITQWYREAGLYKK